VQCGTGKTAAIKPGGLRRGRVRCPGRAAGLAVPEECRAPGLAAQVRHTQAAPGPLSGGVTHQRRQRRPCPAVAGSGLCWRRSPKRAWGRPRTPGQPGSCDAGGASAPPGASRVPAARAAVTARSSTARTDASSMSGIPSLMADYRNRPGRSEARSLSTGSARRVTARRSPRLGPYHRPQGSAEQHGGAHMPMHPDIQQTRQAPWWVACPAPRVSPQAGGPAGAHGQNRLSGPDIAAAQTSGDEDGAQAPYPPQRPTAQCPAPAPATWR
jgi:hypothetical protein